MPGGRPTDYDPALCEQVVQLGRDGKSWTQIAATLDVAKSTLYLWRDAHPEFSDALMYARDLSQAWFEDMGQTGMTMDRFNANLWVKQMTARFPDDYTDRTKNEVSGPNGSAIEHTLTLRFVKPEHKPE